MKAKHVGIIYSRCCFHSPNFRNTQLVIVVAFAYLFFVSSLIVSSCLFLTCHVSRTQAWRYEEALIYLFASDAHGCIAQQLSPSGKVTRLQIMMMWFNSSTIQNVFQRIPHNFQSHISPPSPGPSKLRQSQVRSRPSLVRAAHPKRYQSPVWVRSIPRSHESRLWKLTSNLYIIGCGWLGAWTTKMLFLWWNHMTKSGRSFLSWPETSCHCVISSRQIPFYFNLLLTGANTLWHLKS